MAGFCCLPSLNPIRLLEAVFWDPDGPPSQPTGEKGLKPNIAMAASILAVVPSYPRTCTYVLTSTLVFEHFLGQRQTQA